MSSSRTIRATGEGGGETDRAGVAAEGGSTVSTAGSDPGTVTVNGRTVAYAEYGDADGAPVVFFHGTPGSRLMGELWADAAREAGVRLLAIDRPGYGRSDHWPGRTLADTGAFVAPVLEDAGVERAGLVGFSGGGPHALAVAATHGDRVQSVDLIGTATPPDCVADEPFAERALTAMAIHTPRLLGVMLRGMAWVGRRGPASAVLSAYTDDPGAVPDDVAALVVTNFAEAVGSRAGTVTESRLFAREWDVSLAAVDSPVRLWHGRDDDNVPLAAARALADRLPADSGAPDTAEGASGRRSRVLTVFEDADHLWSLIEARSAVLDAQTGPNCE